MTRTISGGMALTRDAAMRWKETTGVEVNEGYGLTETSPVTSVNFINQINSLDIKPENKIFFISLS